MKVLKPRPNVKWNHSGSLIRSWSYKGDTSLPYLEMLPKAEKEKIKYLMFFLLPDLLFITSASYWPNLSKCQSAREPRKWCSLQHREEQGMHLRVKR